MARMEDLRSDEEDEGGDERMKGERKTACEVQRGSGAA